MKRIAMGAKKSFIWIFVVLSVPLIAGCASRLKGWSDESFRNADFNAATLQTTGLAILPVIVLTPSREIPKEPGDGTPSAPYAPNPSGAEKANSSGEMTREAYQLVLNKILSGKLQLRRPPVHLVTPGDVLVRLNDETLPCHYRRFKDTFTQTGLDTHQLKCFGKTLNSRYLFITQAAISEQQSEASLTIIWTFGRKSLLRSVKVYGQVWDTETGNRIWEGSGVGYHSLNAYETPPLMEKLAEKAVDQMLATFMP